VLGAAPHQAASGQPAHSRIHLFVWRRLAEGRDLRLSDHADIEHGMLPELPQRPVAKICQAAHPVGPRWSSKPSLRRSLGAKQLTLLFLPPYAPELNPKENLWDEIREKIFKNYALKSIDAVYRKLDEAILYIERNPETVKSITSFPYIAKSL
jgi:hypothetical protein